MKGNELIIKLLLDAGANINQSLGLADYCLLNHLRPSIETFKITSPASIATNSTSSGVTNNRDIYRQYGQRGPIVLPTEYMQDKQIYLFEFAALRGHLQIAQLLLEQYTHSNQITSSYDRKLSIRVIDS